MYSCHPAAGTFLPLPQPKLVHDLSTPKGCKAELTCLLTFATNNPVVLLKTSNEGTNTSKQCCEVFDCERDRFGLFMRRETDCQTVSSLGHLLAPPLRQRCPCLIALLPESPFCNKCYCCRWLASSLLHYEALRPGHVTSTRTGLGEASILEFWSAVSPRKGFLVYKCPQPFNYIYTVSQKNLHP